MGELACVKLHVLTGNWLDVLIVEGSIVRGMRWVILFFIQCRYIKKQLNTARGLKQDKKIYCRFAAGWARQYTPWHMPSLIDCSRKAKPILYLERFKTGEPIMLNGAYRG